MRIHQLRSSVTVISVGVVALMPLIASAWTGPSGPPPNNNVSAPINVGTTDQVKNAGIGVNSLAVFGNSLLGGSTGSNAYLNFGPAAGYDGYGMRDNLGTLEFKNSGDTSGTKNGWKTLQETVFALVGGAGSWAVSGNHIYNTNTGNVGIGSTTPGTLLSLGNTGANTINISPTATSTFGKGINIRGGCFAVKGVCIGGTSGGSGSITNLSVTGTNNVNPFYPDGLVGTPIIVSLPYQGSTYTVPAGKTLYITRIGSADDVLTPIKGISVGGVSISNDHFYTPIVLGAGTEVRNVDSGGTAGFNGYLTNSNGLGGP